LVADTDWAYRSKEYFNAVDQTTPFLIERGYWVGNFSVGYSAPRDRYEVRVYALNALDTVYRNTALITGSYSYAPPRTVGVTVSTHF